MKSIKYQIISVLLTVAILWLVLNIQSILTPFILAGILAYFLNPAVLRLKKDLKISHTFAVSIVFITGVSVLIYITTQAGILMARELRDLSREIRYVNQIGQEQVSYFPDIIQPILRDLLINLERGNIFSSSRVWTLFSGTLSRVESIFIFLVATFYFLKDGELFVRKITGRLPGAYGKFSEAIIERTKVILNGYLRGQIFLVILMGSLSFLILALLKVKYAILLGIFTGIAEIVPIIGPIVAGGAAVAVAMLDGVKSLSLTPLLEGTVVASIYFILRELEDIFVIPFVLGKTTSLHPLVVLFTILVGGHIWGILGMILAVPAAVFIRTIAEYLVSFNSLKK